MLRPPAGAGQSPPRVSRLGPGGACQACCKLDARVDPFLEMPLLGYAGYPPFGTECAAIPTLVMNRTIANEIRRRAG